MVMGEQQPTPVLPSPRLPEITAPSKPAETVVPAKPIETAAPARPPAPEPKPTPAARSSPAAGAPAASPEEISEFIARGDQFLATGDIATARLFYERAAEGGSAAAMTAAGKTYDPLYLADVRARGIRGDPVAAAKLYNRAIAAGDHQADALMKRLMEKFGG
jgi:TPR repeat protein